MKKTGKDKGERYEDEPRAFCAKCTYLIKNTVSGYGLAAGSGGKDPGDHQALQWPMDTGQNPDGFGWLLIPAETPYYWIVNQESGYGLVAGSGGEDYSDNQVWQFPLRETDKPEGFKWILLPSDYGGYYIVNKVSGYGLVAGSGGKDPGDHQALQWHIPEQQDDSFIWRIKKYKELDCLKRKPNFYEIAEKKGPEEIGDIDRLTSFKMPKKETDHILIGETLIPFFAIKGDIHPFAFQVKDYPYYKFSREGYWLRQFFKEHGGKTSVTEDLKITVGLSETKEKSTETKMGYKVTSEASLSYNGGAWGGEAKISASIEKQLNVTTTESSSKQEINEHEINVVYPMGEPFALAIWHRVDHYKLRKPNGEVVSESKWINKSEEIRDIFPRYAHAH